jgi:8-oxo-dGTP diphosphatase
VNITASLAVIFDEQQRVLITQRPAHIPYGGCWEFPGGKLEIDETSEAALVREVQEELGLKVLQYRLLGEVNHQYHDKMVKLLIFLVPRFSGQPSCLEGQLAMKWVYFYELDSKDFPPANYEIIKIIKKSLQVKVN